MSEELTKAMAGASLVHDEEWKEEEKAACLAVRDALIKEKGLMPAQVGEVELITITLNSKCRVDEAVTKFMTYHEQLVKEYGINDVWDESGLDDQWHRLAVAGKDEGGRQIMWVHGGGTPVEEEDAATGERRAPRRYRTVWA